MAYAMIPIPVCAFQELYKKEVRVQFAWKRLERECWPVHLGVVEGAGGMSAWFTPWYTRRGAEAAYGDVGAEPLPLREVPSRMGQLTSARRTNIEALAAEYARWSGPVRLDVPLYSLSGRGSLILDSNHRLAAVLLSGKDFKIITFTVSGPIDPTVLPDLLHWSRRTDRKASVNQNAPL